MTQLLLLALWMGLGTVASAVWCDPGQSRFAWTPLASILGPLWLPVAHDFRTQAQQGRRVS